MVNCLKRFTLSLPSAYREQARGDSGKEKLPRRTKRQGTRPKVGAHSKRICYKTGKMIPTFVCLPFIM